MSGHATPSMLYARTRHNQGASQCSMCCVGDTILALLKSTLPPGCLQGSVLVPDCALRHHIGAGQAPAPLVVRPALHPPVQQQPSWQCRRQTHPLTLSFLFQRHLQELGAFYQMQRMPISGLPCQPPADQGKLPETKSALSASQGVGRAEDGTHCEFVLGVQGKGLLIRKACCFWGCYGGDSACASAGSPLTNEATCISISSSGHFGRCTAAWSCPQRCALYFTHFMGFLDHDPSEVHAGPGRNGPSDVLKE